MRKQRPLLAGLMAAVGALVLYRGRVRPWMYTWGTRGDECATVLTGDEMVEPGMPRTTRAVTIDAPVDAV